MAGPMLSFADLPIDLARVIMEEAALSSKQTHARLIGVSPITREWLEPLLYTTLILDNNSVIHSFSKCLDVRRKKDRTFFERTVKTLTIHSHSPSELYYSGFAGLRLAGLNIVRVKPSRGPESKPPRNTASHIDHILGFCSGVQKLAFSLIDPGRKHRVVESLVDRSHFALHLQFTLTPTHLSLRVDHFTVDDLAKYLPLTVTHLHVSYSEWRRSSMVWPAMFARCEALQQLTIGLCARVEGDTYRTFIHDEEIGIEALAKRVLASAKPETFKLLAFSLSVQFEDTSPEEAIESIPDDFFDWVPGVVKRVRAVDPRFAVVVPYEQFSVRPGVTYADIGRSSPWEYCTDAPDIWKIDERYLDENI